MSIFALPALLALLIKVSIIVLAIKGSHLSKLFMGMLTIMAVHNLSEFLAITTLFDGTTSELLLRSYYVAAAFSLAYIFLFSIETSKWLNNRAARSVALGLALAIAVLASGTDYIVAGATSLGYTVTAIKGKWYALFPVFSLVSLTFTTFALTQGLRTNCSAEVQNRSALILFALAPLLLTILVIIVAMNLGASFTGALIIPVSTSAFLFIALKTERGHQVIDVRRFLPFSSEKIVARRVAKAVSCHLNGDIELKATKGEIERILVEHALYSENQNVTWAARRLGVRRTSLYSLMNKMELAPARK